MKQIAAFLGGRDSRGRLVARTELHGHFARHGAGATRRTGNIRICGRSVEAVVKFSGRAFEPPYHMMRWYDTGMSTQ